MEMWQMQHEVLFLQASQVTQKRISLVLESLNQIFNDNHQRYTNYSVYYPLNDDFTLTWYVLHSYIH